MTHVTCRLTAKNRDQLRNPALGSRLWTTCTCSGRVVDAGIPERQRVLSRAARRPSGRVQRATRGTGRLRVHRDRVGALRQRRAAARHGSSVRPAPVPLRVRPRRRLRHKSVALRFSLSLSRLCSSPLFSGRPRSQCRIKVGAIDAAASGPFKK